MNKKPNLLPNIEDYFESINHNLPISILGLEQIEAAIIAKTKLDKNNSKIILCLFFQEIRNALLRKKKIDIRELGSFIISSPAVTSTKKRIFVKFTPKPKLVKKINEKYKKY